MKQKLASLAIAGLTAVALSACSGAPTKTAEAPKAPAVADKPMLTEAAQQALAKADADVKLANAHFALWTTAESALKSAQEAAKAGESDAVIKHAKFVSDQVARGIAQLSYPSTEPK
ncbi:MAG: hypothetical protein Q8M09_04075 [Pseudomonadota bacterium]|nr:hypothetical protein [Pseudomonadota bacterium]MDP1903416.1 hypothetical protein [Pseudomonadota bacterium]MDP2352386.1 hypothetical protein [Pseudomonadota bacterium]